MRLVFRLLWLFPEQRAQQGSVSELYSSDNEISVQHCQNSYREPRQCLLYSLTLTASALLYT